MIQEVTFDWLTRYFCAEILQPSLPYLREGVFHSPYTRQPIPIGEENEFQPGFLLVKNGETTIDQLVQQGWLKPSDIDGFRTVSSYEQFAGFLRAQGKKDGVHIYDTDQERMTRVYELDNKRDEDRAPLLDLVPADFASLEENLGTKTRLALRIPQHLPHVNTYQVKRTANETGLGTVTRISSQGLAEWLFLRREPQGPYVNDEHQLALIHRRYAPRNGRIALAEEEKVVLQPPSRTYSLPLTLTLSPSY